MPSKVKIAGPYETEVLNERFPAASYRIYGLSIKHLVGGGFGALVGAMVGLISAFVIGCITMPYAGASAAAAILMGGGLVAGIAAGAAVGRFLVAEKTGKNYARDTAASGRRGAGPGCRGGRRKAWTHLGQLQNYASILKTAALIKS